MKNLFIILLFVASSLHGANDDAALTIIKKNFDNMEFEKVISLSRETKKTPELQYYIAISYMFANERTKDDQKTLELLNKLSKNGYKPAKEYLAFLYRRGYIVNKDLKYSEQLYKELGDKEEANSIKDLKNQGYTYLPYKSYMNTVRFLQLSIRNNISKTKEYLPDTLKYRSKSNEYNIPIKKKNIDKIYNRLFNGKYKSLVLAEWKKNHNLCSGLFRPGYEPRQSTPSIMFGSYNKSIHIWFYDDGIPYVIASDFMIKASFDCNKAGSATEIAICDSYVLSDLDTQLSNIYQDAKVYLTDNTYLNLKKEQRAFLGQRNKCKNNNICIENIMKRRLNELDTLIEDEYSKDTSSIQKYKQKIEGSWKNKKYIDAMDGPVPANYDHDTYIKPYTKIKKIVIKLPKVLFYDKNNKVFKTCTVDKTVFDTWAKVYERTAYRNHYAGSGGNMYISRLPYAGHYISLSLSEDAGFLILSGQKLDRLFYSKIQTDDILVTEGLLLQK